MNFRAGLCPISTKKTGILNAKATSQTTNPISRCSKVNTCGPMSSSFFFMPSLVTICLIQTSVSPASNNWTIFFSKVSWKGCELREQAHNGASPLLRRWRNRTLFRSDIYNSEWLATFYRKPSWPLCFVLRVSNDVETSSVFRVTCESKTER